MARSGLEEVKAACRDFLDSGGSSFPFSTFEYSCLSEGVSKVLLQSQDPSFQQKCAALEMHFDPLPEPEGSFMQFLNSLNSLSAASTASVCSEVLAAVNSLLRLFLEKQWRFSSVLRDEQQLIHTSLNWFEPMLTRFEDEVLFNPHVSSERKKTLSEYYCTQFVVAVERFLGDALFSLFQNHESDSDAEVPRIMRDLVVHPLLVGFFAQRSSLLRIIASTLVDPKGLNLRNVAWHGFLRPGKEWSVGLTLVPICIAFLLAKTCRENGLVVTPRPLLSCTQLFNAEKYLGIFGLNTTGGVKPLLPPLSPSFISHQHNEALAERIFTGSVFSFNGQHRRFADALAFYRGHDNVMALAAALPALEHSLRFFYAVCNDLPVGLLTAESTVLYTTLDSILAEFVPPEYAQSSDTAATASPPPAVRNRLPAVLGHAAISAIADLFLAGKGPRLRDRFSHGEAAQCVWTSETGDVLVAFLLGLILHLSIRFSTTQGLSSDVSGCSLKAVALSSSSCGSEHQKFVESFQEISRFFSHYTLRLSPCALFLSQVTTLPSPLLTLHTLAQSLLQPQPNADPHPAPSPSDTDLYSVVFEQNHTFIQ
eukprot:GCRY01004183.1.p1 GENE.GCRY01004183.1~~GCRY01004183.1.p1  ORF type:complete len:594 (+),score=117.12 GCRY01004183.1:182-1963(+)